MTARTIVTSQPDVACDVCERRLLRGEQPDVFLVTGRRRIVCELCVPRAVHEGWLREADGPPVTLPPLRPRRGRSLLDRLLHARRPSTHADEAPVLDADELGGRTAGEPQPYEFLGHGDSAGGADPTGPDVRSSEADPAPGEQPAAASPAVRRTPSSLDRALETFNSSEHPRRVAGVARSLGAPEVNVRSAEHAESVVRILVAWELCWYRYEVDLDEPEAGARVAAQGTELSELSREERLVNAQADDSGALSLSGE
jgi:hypothetical protein